MSNAVLKIEAFSYYSLQDKIKLWELYPCKNSRQELINFICSWALEFCEKETVGDHIHAYNHANSCKEQEHKTQTSPKSNLKTNT